MPVTRRLAAGVCFAASAAAGSLLLAEMPPGGRTAVITMISAKAAELFFLHVSPWRRCADIVGTSLWVLTIVWELVTFLGLSPLPDTAVMLFQRGIIYPLLVQEALSQASVTAANA
jgi:hypothetical protein